MTQTGTLTMSEGDSRLDGTLLARKGDSDPLGAATNFLSNLGLQSGRITVTGDNGNIGPTSVIFITDAKRADERVALAAAVETEAAAPAVLRRSPPRTKPKAKVVRKKTLKNNTAKQKRPRRKK
jgi:hypothetical protein